MILYPSWRSIAPTPPADPTNPADPAYRFATLDAVGRRRERARTRGRRRGRLRARPGRRARTAPAAPSPAPGSPTPPPSAQFATALAARYSGTFTPSGGLGPLPRVGYFQPWAEPNLALRLSPQYENGRPTSPARYRQLLNSFYDGIKAAAPAAKVVGAGAAPYGDPGQHTSRWRRFASGATCSACANRKRLKPTACPEKAKLDVFAHNAITRPGGPTDAAELADNASTADFGKLRTRHPRRRAPQDGPPRRSPAALVDRDVVGVEPARQERTASRSAVRRGGSSRRSTSSGRTAPASPSTSTSATGRPGNGGIDETLQDGLYFRDGKPKPASDRVSVPARHRQRRQAHDRLGPGSPAAGRLVIERRAGGGWRRVASEQVGAGDVFQQPAGDRRSRIRCARGSAASRAWSGGSAEGWRTIRFRRPNRLGSFGLLGAPRVETKSRGKIAYARVDHWGGRVHWVPRRRSHGRAGRFGDRPRRPQHRPRREPHRRARLGAEPSSSRDR